MIRLMIFTVFALSACFANANNSESRAIRCTGDTNYGDVVDLEFRLEELCEGNSGSHQYCKVEVVVLEEVDQIAKGSRSSLFLQTPEHRLVFENGLMPRFVWPGIAFDITAQKLPMDVSQPFTVDISFGGGRTNGSAVCRVLR